jgi:hypothetical protein
MTDSAFTPDTVVVVTPSSVSADMGGEEIILNLKTGIYFGLDEVGARIWSLLKEPRSVASILETLLAEYDVESERCKADLLALLENLSGAQLIEVK